MLGPLVIGFFQMVLFCAIVIFVAFLFVWGLNYFLGIQLDGNLYKWGRVIVGLICFIAFLTWLFGALGLGGGSRYFRIGSADRGHAATRTMAAECLPRMLI